VLVTGLRFRSGQSEIYPNGRISVPEFQLLLTALFATLRMGFNEGAFHG
jgi:hypothetical protein